MLVDDHLVILDDAGEVVVAEASPDSYRERQRLQVLEEVGSGVGAWGDAAWQIAWAAWRQSTGHILATLFPLAG